MMGVRSCILDENICLGAVDAAAAGDAEALDWLRVCAPDRVAMIEGVNVNEIRNDLSLMERETVFSITADNRAECVVFTDDVVWYRRLSKWFTPEWCDGRAARFRVPTALVVREYALTAGNQTLERHAGGDTCESSDISSILTAGSG